MSAGHMSAMSEMSNGSGKDPNNDPFAHLCTGEEERQKRCDHFWILAEMEWLEDNAMALVHEMQEVFNVDGVALITDFSNTKAHYFAQVGYGNKRFAIRRDLLAAHMLGCDDSGHVIEDAVKDPRFYNHPQVINQPFIRFFCMVGLRTHTGDVFGTLEIFDSKPREMTDEEEKEMIKYCEKVVGSLTPFEGWEQKELRLIKDGLIKEAGSASSSPRLPLKGNSLTRNSNSPKKDDREKYKAPRTPEIAEQHAGISRYSTFRTHRTPYPPSKAKASSPMRSDPGPPPVPPLPVRKGADTFSFLNKEFEFPELVPSALKPRPKSPPSSNEEFDPDETLKPPKQGDDKEQRQKPREEKNRKSNSSTTEKGYDRGNESKERPGPGEPGYRYNAMELDEKQREIQKRREEERAAAALRELRKKEEEDKKRDAWIKKHGREPMPGEPYYRFNSLEAYEKQQASLREMKKRRAAEKAAEALREQQKREEQERKAKEELERQAMVERGRREERRIWVETEMRLKQEQEMRAEKEELKLKNAFTFPLDGREWPLKSDPELKLVTSSTFPVNQPQPPANDSKRSFRNHMQQRGNFPRAALSPQAFVPEEEWTAAPINPSEMFSREIAEGGIDDTTSWNEFHNKFRSQPGLSTPASDYSEDLLPPLPRSNLLNSSASGTNSTGSLPGQKQLRMKPSQSQLNAHAHGNAGERLPRQLHMQKSQGQFNVRGNAVDPANHSLRMMHSMGDFNTDDFSNFRSGTPTLQQQRGIMNMNNPSQMSLNPKMNNSPRHGPRRNFTDMGPPTDLVPLVPGPVGLGLTSTPQSQNLDGRVPNSLLKKINKFVGPNKSKANLTGKAEKDAQAKSRTQAQANFPTPSLESSRRQSPPENQRRDAERRAEVARNREEAMRHAELLADARARADEYRRRENEGRLRDN